MPPIKLGAYDGAPMKCTALGCTRPTTRAAGTGVGDVLCRYHTQHQARHGSTFAKTFRAADRHPYVAAAGLWIKQHREAPEVKMALHWLGGLLGGAGRVERAVDIKRKPAAERARFAFARLREAGVEPDRMLATYLGIAALVDDDRESHRSEEFRVVQVAKALHRLASGTHQRWERPLNNGKIALIQLHTYPKSSGMVLRIIGRQIEEACRGVAGQAVQEVIALRREEYGLHPSHLPGWEPAWHRRMRGGR